MVGKFSVVRTWVTARWYRSSVTGQFRRAYVYTPPDYDTNIGMRYPVLYDLPASGQTPKSGANVVRRMNEGIRAARLSPMIVVLVNGLRGNTIGENHVERHGHGDVAEFGHQGGISVIGPSLRGRFWSL